ncbi:HAD family hydrolase [Sphingomonas sp. NPDC092331]|uniref:HAD family hydrolase n=1 Tax=unclassified Sphingomonas TaxID=196159 RepID=UPI0031F54D72
MANAILPHALPSALDAYPGVTLLSLDCFDTLLWRDVHAPHDLFGALGGANLLQRSWAEQTARSTAAVRHRRNEVHIDEIYAELMPNANAAERAAAVQDELDAEARHCFAFRPTVELMRAARARGIETIIVSDTYLDEKQLRGLIAAAAGEDVAGLIGRIFCSSHYGKSKGEGLYEPVLKALQIAPDRILHIGDNKKADVDGVAPFGVNTLHLAQFTADSEQRIRLESAISNIFHPTEAGVAITHQPHRATIAAIEPQLGDAAEMLGFTTLGPVLNGFDRWLDDEAAALRAKHGGTVHAVFLMRDGYLPQRVHQARGGTGHAVEISRFTATAASLGTAEAVERHLQRDICSDLSVVAKQLLLPAPEAAKLIKDHPRPGAFLKAIRDPQRMRRITNASHGFAERLVAHVRKIVNPARGDTLMLVDLGYNGSVQNDVEPLLARALGVRVAGRYLLLREQSRTGLDKKGFIGHDDYDCAALEALCTNVAVLEQLCTAAQGSVVDYEKNGTAIRRGSSIKSRQSDVRDRVQAGCLRFVRDEGSVTIRARRPAHEAILWRRGAAGVLGRLMYVPLEAELAVLGAFEHDINLGVDNTVSLFDPAIARRGLRQRGLFYMKGAERMYLPAELHGEGLALKLSLLAQRRFAMPLKYRDFVDTSIALPLIVADGNQVSTGTVTATPTHDGYYLAPIPIGDSRFSVGVQFGQLFDYVQVESVTFMPVDRFLSDKQHPDGNQETEALPSLEGMEQVAPHLFRCENEFAFMMVPPPPRQEGRQMMLALAFRPIAARQAAAPAPSHAALQGAIA